MEPVIDLCSLIEYDDRVDLHHRLNERRKEWSDGLRRQLAARRFFLILQSKLIKKAYRLRVDGVMQSEKTYVRPISRRTFSKFLNAVPNPNLMDTRWRHLSGSKRHCSLLMAV